MLLILFRHGIAEDDGPDGTDASRRLTPEGREKTLAASLGLSTFAEIRDIILTSPLTRAEQTAEIAAEVFGRPVETWNLLAGGAPQKIIKHVCRRPETVVMMVGHEPTFSMIVELLCAPDRTGGFVQLKKAGCACVDVTTAADHALVDAQLQWLATPKMLRRLASSVPDTSIYSGED